MGVRFASCEMPSQPTVPVDVPPPLAIDQVDALERSLSDPAVAGDIAAAVMALNDYRARTRDRVTAAADDLARALADGLWAPVPAAPTSAGPLAEHVWVQAEQGTTWLDVDPTTPTGRAPCAAVETADALPDSLWHTIRFRLTTEHQSSGSLVETTVLDTTQRTADLAAARITVGFGEPMGLIESSADEDDPELTYTPLLRVDDTSMAGEPLSVVRPVEEDDGGGTLGGFDPFGGIGEPGPPTEVDPVTAVWLDIGLTAPSGATRHLRSEVFDRLGPEPRAAGTAGSAPVRPLDLVAGGYGAFDATWHVGLLLGERRQPDGDEPAFLDLPSLDITTIDGLAATVDALLRLYPALRRDLGGDTSSPVVLLAGVSQVQGPRKRGGLEPGDISTRFVLDALLVPASAPRDLETAVRDAQATLAAEGMLVALAGDVSGPLDDALGVFDSATAAGTPWLVLRPQDPRRPAGVSAAARARIDARLADGYWLVTPATAPSVGGVTGSAWWFVDPVTGVIRDEDEQGRHAAMTEYGSKNAETTSRWQSFCDFAWSIRRGFVIAAAALFIGTGGAVGGEALKAVVKVVEAQQKGQKAGEEALRIGCPRQSAGSGPPLP
jgi:hypothetical protein